MGYIGRTLRRRRLLFPGSQCGLIVPIDHGLTAGPLPGLTQLRSLSRWIGSEHISAVLGHKGVIEKLVAQRLLGPSTGVIVHLNGMASLGEDPDTKHQVTGVEAALHLGADAVSVQVNFTGSNFAHNLSLLGQVSDAARRVGLPLMAMVYDKVCATNHSERMLRMHHLIRLTTELGVDAVKVSLPENLSEMQELLGLHHDHTQIFFAGGTRMDERRLCEMAACAVRLGACGLCAGRNVFQHPQPVQLLKRLRDCMHGDVLPDDAFAPLDTLAAEAT